MKSNKGIILVFYLNFVIVGDDVASNATLIFNQNGVNNLFWMSQILGACLACGISFQRKEMKVIV